MKLTIKQLRKIIHESVYSPKKKGTVRIMEISDSINATGRMTPSQLKAKYPEIFDIWLNANVIPNWKMAEKEGKLDDINWPDGDPDYDGYDSPEDFAINSRDTFELAPREEWEGMTGAGTTIVDGDKVVLLHDASGGFSNQTLILTDEGFM